MAFDMYLSSLMVYLHEAYPVSTSLALWISTVGSPTIMITGGLLAFAWSVYRRSWLNASIWIVSIVLSASTVVIFKTVFFRARPEDMLVILTDSSFPSGHALMSAVFFTLLGYVMIQNVGSKLGRFTIISLCTLATILVGYSRLVLNVHWLTDVISGWIIGAIVVSISIYLVGYLRSKFK